MSAVLERIAALPTLARATLAIAAACAASIAVMAVALSVVEPRGDAAADWPPATPEAAAAQPEAMLGMALEQIYRAFGETGETAIYDALARVAADDALEALYLQRRDALVNAAFDGGAQRVDHVDVLAAEATVEADRVAIDGRWRVIGAVGHEDHQHVRGAAYTARLSFALRPEGWRVVAFDLRDIDREAIGAPVDP
jgi:hypothetical protein